MMSEDERLFELAEKRVKAKQSFRVHLVSYLAVNAFLIAVYMLTRGGYFWPIWPILGWGVGLAIHWGAVYATRTTEQEVQAEYRRLKGKSLEDKVVDMRVPGEN